MSEIQYQVVNLSDPLSQAMAATLHELDINYFPTPWTLQAWQHLHESEHLLIVAKADQKIIAFCLFDTLASDCFAHLLKILVSPDYRKERVGTTLFGAALERLINSGIRKLFLEVEEDNVAAQKLYFSLGFKIIHRKKDFYGSGRNALIMTQQLNESH